MYSGITGVELRADIYFGVVFYQRLRHMVSDKYQVRTTGPVHNLTQQPVKVSNKQQATRTSQTTKNKTKTKTKTKQKQKHKNKNTKTKTKTQKQKQKHKNKCQHEALHQ